MRIIARLDIKGPNLIKGVQMEGLRVVGSPADFARSYYQQGVDELLYMDFVASLYGRNGLHEIVRATAAMAFVPLTVGGGIRCLEDATLALRSGADKIAVNTAAIADPSVLTKLACQYGAQCVVLSLDAKSTGPGRWEAYSDGGRERSGKDAIAWVREAVSKGAGEILVTSIDREGTRRGMDLDLIRAVSEAVTVPVIGSGGVGTVQHVVEAVTYGYADAVAIADGLHYQRFTVQDVRNCVREAGIPVRQVIHV